MGLFRKKNKVSKTANDVLDEQSGKNEINKAEFNVVLLEKLGGTVREISSFDGVRFRDDQDHVVYLKNNSKKFLEIFPQQINDFKNYTKEEVQKLLKIKQEALQKERHTDSDRVNDKDLEYDILKLQAKMRSFEYEENSSYLSFDKNSRPTFYFLREGSNFFPFKWDTDTKTIFVPSDNRKKSASLALRNKEQKYNTNTMVTGAAILLIIIGVIFAGGGGYFMLKSKSAYQEAFESYDQSEIAAAQRLCLENLNEASKQISTSASNVQKITDSIEGELNKPQTIIQGVIPE